MSSIRRTSSALTLLFAFLLLTMFSFGQVTDGNLVGTVYDTSGKVIPNAVVGVQNNATGVMAETKSDPSGAYRFNNLPVGTYNITISSAGFKSAQLNDLSVQLNVTATANATLTIGATTDSVDVVASSALLNTTNAQIANTFATRMLTDNPLAALPAGGYQNLALLGAGVASAGGVGAGTGPSVGGQRPRNNNNMVEGVENNRKDITGPVVSLPNDSVAEFTVLQNQFSAEFGHSSGGQFNAVIQSGSNDLHGKIYDYLQNRNLNALDQFWKRQGIFSQPRYDYNLLGGALGGPIQKNKIFYYGNFDYNPTGGTASPSAYAPTADGYATLAGIAGVSATNVGVLKQYVGVAPQQTNGFTSVVKGNAIPYGLVPIAAPAYQNVYRWLVSGDYNITENDQWRVRYVSNKTSRIDTGGSLPAFFFGRPTTAKLFSTSEFHAFRPDLANEVRLAYNRFNDDDTSVPATQFPGLDMFPNIVVRDLGTQIGPNANAPQSVVQNVYQIADNLTWVKGKHSLKFGFDGRDNTSSINFISAIRGNYQYRTLERYVLDMVPDFTAQRAVGNSAPYSGNNYALYFFGNDDWKMTRNFSISLGLRYEFTTVARSMKEYTLNSLADVPGVLTFFEPKPQTKNFAPRLGFAYSPGKSATTSIRGGFSLAYDQIFDNIGLNVRPPQVNSLVTSTVTTATGYLAGGGILPNVVPIVTATQARAATSGWLDNQKLGYAINWNLGVQHVFGKDYVLDVRYLGTKGVHLLMQTQLGRTPVVSDTHYLPTYLQTPSAAELDALPLTLTQLQTESKAKSNSLGQYGFNQVITSYVPQGNSQYHGLAVDLNKRLSQHLTFKGAYTWSHLMDDSTMELNFTSLTPRRPQDFLNLRPEWASSALDHRHRLSLTWLYQTPWFEKNGNWWLRNVAGNYQLGGVYIVESPEWVTPQSATDSNLNTDAIGDRVIVNPNGVSGVGSDATALKNSAGQTVGYLAVNPNAQFIKAQQGALATSGRNVLPTNPINNVDLNVVKSFTAGERYHVEIRADFYNALNHPQYTPGRTDSVLSLSNSSVTTYLTPGNPLFGKWDQVFGSNSRLIQLAAKFSF